MHEYLNIAFIQSVNSPTTLLYNFFPKYVAVKIYSQVNSATQFSSLTEPSLKIIRTLGVHGPAHKELSVH